MGDRRLVEIVEGFGSPRVLVVGGLILDRYVWGAAERLSPEGPVPVLLVEREEGWLGGVGRVVENLAAFGARVDLVSALGDDDAGAEVRGLLAARGISDANVVVEPGRPTRVKTRYLTRSQQLLRVDRESRADAGADAARKVSDLAVRAAGSADVVVISDYDPRLLASSVIGAVVTKARRCGVKVLIDTAKTDDFTRYRGASVITPNRREAGMATGARLDGPAEVARAAERLSAELDLEAVMITLGAEGIGLKERGRDFEVLPARRRPAYDVTGAGDMVMSALAMAVGAGATWREAACLANLTAGIEVERIGAVPVTRDELLAALTGPAGVRPEKLLSLDVLTVRLAEHRRRGESVALTWGCFDILHSGHR